MKQLLLSVFFISTYLLSLGQSDTYTWKKQTTITYPGKQDDTCFINENIGFVGTMTRGYQTTDGGKPGRRPILVGQLTKYGCMIVKILTTFMQ